MADRTIEDVLRDCLAKTGGNADAALGLIQSWTISDSTISLVVEAFTWEIIHGYLLDLRDTAIDEEKN